MSTPSKPVQIMAESNERLARVETRLDHHGDLLERMDEHLRRLSEAQETGARTMAEMSGTMRQFLDVAQQTADQDRRITTLEAVNRATQARLKAMEALPSKVERNSSIARAGVWLACALLVAVIGAVIKGWFS